MKKTTINKFIVFAIPALVSFLLYFGLQRAESWILLSVLLAIIMGYGVFYFNKLFSALLLLSFSLPLSVEYEIFNGVQMIIPTEFLAIIISIAMAFGLLNKLNKVKALIHDNKPFFALVLVIFIGTIFSTDFIVSVKYSLVYILYLCSFTWSVYYISLKGKEAFIYIIMAYTAGFFLAFFWSLYHWSLYEFNPVTVPKVFEPFYADHTIFGASAAILFVFWFGQIRREKLLKSKIVAVIVLIIITIALRVAGSRAALLSIPFALALFYVLKWGIQKRHVAVLVLSLLAVLALFQNKVVEAFQYNNYNSRDEHANLIERTASVTNVQTDVSNLERINRWAAALNMFKEKPILGFGPGTFQYAYIPFQDPKFKNHLSVEDPFHIPVNSGGTVHSEPLLFLSELGIMGFLAWFVLVFSWLWKAFSLPIFLRSDTVVIAFAMLGTYFFHGLFNNFLNTDKFAFLFWGSLGFILSRLKYAK